MIVEGIIGFGGYSLIIFFCFKLLKAVYAIVFPYFFAVPKDLLALAGANWAVVTGSTDGIGKAYAFELAQKGFNLVLISRSTQKLNSVADEIKDKYPNIQIKNITFDFSNAKIDDYEKMIFTEMEQLQVGILINNVGLSYEYPERINKLEGDLQRVTDITVVNILPTTVLSAYVLKQMSERNSGIVVNIASASSYYPFSHLAIYSAAKKYVSWLSEILRKEYANVGIIIQTLSPMYVATNMTKMRRTSFFILNPESFVKQAVKTIGHATETTGCYEHQMQVELFGFLPDIVKNKISTNMCLRARKQALKKRNATNKSFNILERDLDRKHIKK